MLLKKIRTKINEAVSVRVNNRNVKKLYNTYVEVDSSNLHSIFYDPKKKIMRVRFKSDNKVKGEVGTYGTEYEYYRVPERVFILLLNSPSHGSEFWKRVRNYFKYSRLADWDSEDEEEY